MAPTTKQTVLSMICRHGNETCDECAKLLTVAEAVQFRADNPGTTQQEAAEMAGTTRQAIAKQETVTKRNQLPNVTADPFTSNEGCNDLQPSCQLVELDDAEIPDNIQAILETLRPLTRGERSYIRVWISLNWVE